MAAAESYLAVRTMLAHENAEVIVPDNSAELRIVASAIYVGAAGDITLLTVRDQVVLFKAVPVGTILPIRTRRVNSTGTTASLLLALW